MKKKYEYVKSLRLAGFLMQHGFRILKIHHDLDINGKDVYVFEQTERLTEKILEYINRRTEC